MLRGGAARQHALHSGALCPVALACALLGAQCMWLRWRSRALACTSGRSLGRCFHADVISVRGTALALGRTGLKGGLAVPFCYAVWSHVAVQVRVRARRIVAAML